MKVKVIKRKAASHKELSHSVYEIPDVTYLHELLYQIMTVERSAIPEFVSAGKIVYETYQEQKYTLDQAWNIVKQDFADGLFRVFFNQKEYTQMEEVLEVQEENELVIIKLIMMAGRLW